MDDKNKKEELSFNRAFSNEKGALGSFLLLFLPGFFGAICLLDIIQGRFTWRSIVFFLVVSAVCSVLYFIAKFLAYHTKIFSNFKKREKFHVICFFSLILFFFIMYIAAMKFFWIQKHIFNATEKKYRKKHYFCDTFHLIPKQWTSIP